MMRIAAGYTPRHLRRRPHRRGPAVVGAAATVWLASAAPARGGVHVVRRGETLSAIADRYDTSIGRLARANDLANPNFIVAGRRLRIPGRATSRSTHVVRPGETLSSIAQRYGTSIARLARMNDLRDVHLIVVGQRLKVPGAASGFVPSPRAARPTIKASLERQSRAHGVDTALVKAVAWLESGWRQRAVSKAGAVGVMQVMPDTARYVNQSLGGGHLRIRRADDNVHLGVMYLHHMLRIMPSEPKALAAYYTGPGNVHRRLSKSQRWYARTVRSLKSRFR